MPQQDQHQQHDADTLPDVVDFHDDVVGDQDVNQDPDPDLPADPEVD